MSSPPSQKKIALVLVVSFSALALAGFLGISAISNHYPCITETATGMQCPPPSFPYDAANFHLTILKSFVIAVISLLSAAIISKIQIWSILLRTPLVKEILSDGLTETSDKNSSFQIDCLAPRNLLSLERWLIRTRSAIWPFATFRLAFANTDTESV
ncbi:MAG: hypothetical protein A3G59_00070 [Candidatus Taylorbacteria bacterium RIFCSPLOWO2_12_FULL_47_20]|uniref:Uncharacterized protein n=2 Tax=Candidatus Tayloriibacteriota TaxID=1817919 RepID=A0A1G2PBB3_9BACT|nr:MAG: hypothetical protein A3H68_02185 [Candidatus Taylorbacteria bacterium RIFCSPLOWO2_02_FULL_46_40]OHA45618.1 MAG: hypothetical protein A3G59_00070 [Candidatus Taylorbacteria bacterium RIFCSPLOWO2_12_FULL_47_20]